MIEEGFGMVPAVFQSMSLHPDLLEPLAQFVKLKDGPAACRCLNSSTGVSCRSIENCPTTGKAGGRTMNQENTDIFEDVIEGGPYPIRFPRHRDLDQDEEWCEVKYDEAWHRVRFHDYRDVYTIPGLYETIFYRTLRCNSPNRVVGLLEDVLNEHGFPPEELRVLDLGAGNGMVGEVLQNLGTRQIVGTDIIPEAKTATERDRPWVYNDYYVADFTDLPADLERTLRDWDFNALTVVAALGYGDIPARAFLNAFNLIRDGGWIAFNIKEDFLRDEQKPGFSGLLNRLTRRDIIQMEAYKRYCHRLNIAGEPLHYIAAAARKIQDIPEAMIKD